MSQLKVEQMHESVMNLWGSNLYHDKESNVLFWCDVLGQQILKMDLNDHNKMWMFRLLGEKYLSFCVPVQGKWDQFIVGAGRRLLLVHWDGTACMGQITKVLCELPVAGVRWNVCRVDKLGRLFLGTMICEDQGETFDMHKRVGSLYRFTMQEGLTMLKDNVGLGNGMCWNNNWTKMFFVDSYDLNVLEFDYDLKTGNISNKKVLVDFTKHCQWKKVFPDDLTIDMEDNLYMSMFGTGKIYKYSLKTKKIEKEIEMDVHQITDMVFGGKNSETLYVLSCGMDWMNEQQSYPCGYPHKISGLGVKGMPMPKFVMN